MKIWWCQEHGASEPSHDEPDPFHKCYEWWIGEMNPDDPPLPTDCVLVPMRLIPDNAEALERAAKALCDWDDDDGHLHDERYREGYRQGVRIVLAALDGETP